MTEPAIVLPYQPPLDLIDALADEATNLGHPAVVALLQHAANKTLLAVDWEATRPAARDRSAWLALASYAYHEAGVLIAFELTKIPGNRDVSPEMVLSLVANADRACALAGQGDIDVSHWIGHLTEWPGEVVKASPLDLLFGDLRELLDRFDRLEEMSPGMDAMALSYAKASMDGQIGGVRRAVAVLLGFLPDEEADREGKVDQAYQEWLAGQ